MKTALLAVALFFGCVGWAVGAGRIAPWRHTAPSYFCKGYQGAAWCRLRGTPYETFVTHGQASIVFQGEVIMSCNGRYADPYDDCNDFR